MHIETFGFTRNRIRDIPNPSRNRAVYKDIHTVGLQLRVTQRGVKTFSFISKLKGKTYRYTIGKYPDISVREAQQEALRLKNLLKQGIDPKKEKTAENDKQITLEQCLQDYLSVHNELKPKTKRDYISIITRLLPDWYKKPLANISRSDVAHRHRVLSKKTPAQANRLMRVLRALFNFANQEYEDVNGRGLFPDNPVHRLSHQRQWNRIERRSGVLKPHQIKPWLTASNRLPELTDMGDVLRDYIQLVLFTGLRKSEALTLKWENIDFEGKTILVSKTKNNKPHILPISDYMMDILQRRFESKKNDYVFPARYSNKHLTDPNKALRRIDDLIGIKVTLHDLRRTFISIAESLDFSRYTLKRLVNHSTDGDVTGGYIVWGAERLRKPMQQITDFILEKAELKECRNVVYLNKKQS